MTFQPDYKNIQDAAYNKAAARLPLYEHLISDKVMEDVLGKEFGHLFKGSQREKEEYFTHFIDFYLKMGYDSVSFERCIGNIMPHSGLLMGHGASVINTYEDFEKYPWDEIEDLYFAANTPYFDALEKALPPGMKAIGGVGNGVFECIQDIIGYMNLAFIASDDPVLYRALFKKMGDVSLCIWKRFMARYGDMYCVLRFGDDLGFKTNTLLPAEDIRQLVVPEYAKIIAFIHSCNKPFLLHSCGYIFDVMPDMINVAKINAKHSNEDQIGLFPVWVEKYGAQIGNFGGIDTDAVCRLSPVEIKEYVKDVLKQCGQYENAGGIAFGSGNSIPEYVPAGHYVAMVEAVREWR